MTPARMMPVAELRKMLGDTVARAAYANERTIITKHGKPAAAIVSAADLELLERLEAASDIRAYDQAKAADNGERIRHEDLKSDLGL